MKHLQLLTNSSARTFRRCPREYRFRYVEGYTSTRESQSLRFGTLVHAALEVWWLAIAAEGTATPEAETVQRALQALHDAASGLDVDAAALIRARCMLSLYHARWFAETAAEYEVLGVEREFRAPLVNPETGAASRTFERAGKLDAIVRHRPTGRILIPEHKTSSENIGPGSPYWEKLTMDGQIGAYVIGARSLGFERIDGCLYDVLGKPKHEPHKATPIEERKYTKATKNQPSRLYADQREVDETLEEYEARVIDAMCADPERYVRRGVIVRMEDEARDAAFDDWQTARAIREAEFADRWPRNTDSCLRFNRRCDYFGVCSHVDTFESENFRREAPHRELAHEEQPQQQERQEIAQ